MEDKTNLQEIWKLQEIDTDIKNLEERKEKLPAELLPFRQNWEAVKLKLEEMKKTFESMQVERKGKEGEVAANEEAIKKHNIQLFSLKSNKEYTAMLKEIENFKVNNKELEDKILELMEKSEKYTLVMKEKQKEVKIQEEAFKKEEERVNSEIARIESRLGCQRAARDSQKNKVELSLLRKYEKIRQGKNGLGIVSVADNSCNGCHINLPPQIVNEVKMRRVIFCGNCARLLYWDEDLQ